MKKKMEELYPVGSQVELISITDPYTDLRPGSRGVVDYIDSLGTVFVRWENGSGLGLIYNEDRWKSVP